MKFEIHFEFRGSLRNFQDLNFWDATSMHVVQRRQGRRTPMLFAWENGLIALGSLGASMMLCSNKLPSMDSEREIGLTISYNRFWWLTYNTNHVD
jgi:hypothetical protein